MRIFEVVPKVFLTSRALDIYQLSVRDITSTRVIRTIGIEIVLRLSEELLCDISIYRLASLFSNFIFLVHSHLRIVERSLGTIIHRVIFGKSKLI